MIKHNEYLLVEVPEGATDFQLLTKPGEKDFWKLPDDNAVDLYANGVLNTPIALLFPRGQYQLIGLAAELTEEQWREIVRPEFKHGYQKFIDYKNQGHDLLRSHNLKPETTIVIKEIKK